MATTVVQNLRVCRNKLSYQCYRALLSVHWQQPVQQGAPSLHHNPAHPRAMAMSAAPQEHSTTSPSIVTRIHNTEAKIVLYVTGGGSLVRYRSVSETRCLPPITRAPSTAPILQAISDLLTVPGASATVLEAIVPYSTAATADLLGSEPESYCSSECATMLAERAFQRAAQLTKPGDTILGVACTAALATVRPEQPGPAPDRCHNSRAR